MINILDAGVARLHIGTGDLNAAGRRGGYRSVHLYKSSDEERIQRERYCLRAALICEDGGAATTALDLGDDAPEVWR